MSWLLGFYAGAYGEGRNTRQREKASRSLCEGSWVVQVSMAVGKGRHACGHMLAQLGEGSRDETAWPGDRPCTLGLDLDLLLGLQKRLKMGHGLGLLLGLKLSWKKGKQMGLMGLLKQFGPYSALGRLC